MILMLQQNHQEQPSSVTSPAPPMTIHVPLSSTGKVTPPINDNSNPQQGTGSTGSLNILTNPSKEQILPSIATMMEGNHAPPTPEISPREEVSVGDSGLVTLNDSPYTSNQGGSHESIIAKDARKLFVGGLPTDITQPEFQTFFGQFGELQDAVVMFDRDTKCSRGFGFVTYVDPEVSKSLLRMGDRNDGIGRLVMRGKTCEIKAATPKGEAGYNARRTRGGSTGGKSNSSNGELRSNNEVPRSLSNTVPSYPYSTQMGYPMMLDPLAAGHSYNHPHHYQYPYANGYPPYGMSHMPYYSGMPPPNQAGMYQGMDTAATASPHYYMSPYDPAAAAASRYYYVHSQQYPYAPAMMPVTDAAVSMQTSVMQPVAPGIPEKEGEPIGDILEDNQA